MLKRVLSPFLTLEVAQGVIEAEGYNCDQKGLISLAMAKEIEICFPYNGFVLVVPADEIAYKDRSEHDIGPSRRTRFCGYLALTSWFIGEANAAGMLPPPLTPLGGASVGSVIKVTKEHLIKNVPPFVVYRLRHKGLEHVGRGNSPFEIDEDPAGLQFGVMTLDLAAFLKRRKVPHIRTNEELLDSERESVNKLIIGMAMSGYKFNPLDERSAAVGQISNDLELLGVSIDQKTIRKWLLAGVKLLPTSTKD